MHTPCPNLNLSKKDYNLVMGVCSLSKSPKVSLNSSINISKSLSDNDWCSTKGAHQTRVIPLSKMPMNPTWARPFE